MSRTLLTACLTLAGSGAGLLLAGRAVALPDALQFLCRAALLLGLPGAAFVWTARRRLGAARTDALLLNLGLAAAVILCGLVVWEHALRYAFRDVTTTSDLRSYFSAKWRRGVRLNRNGFRAREIRRKKDDGTYRIAVIGDSFTFGQGVEEEERFTDVLERRLNVAAAGGMRYEVLNFGRLGAETEDHLEILHGVALDLEPDFVLLQWYANDVEGRDKSRRPQPLRLLPSDFLTVRLRERSALYYLLDRRWAYLQRRAGWVGSYEDYMTERFGDRDGTDYRAARRMLQSFIRSCAESGVPMGIVLFPDLSGEVDLGFLHERVLEQCARHDLACLDLLPVFRRQAEVSALWASRLDPHPGPEAHRIAAEHLVQAFGFLWLSAPGGNGGVNRAVAGQAP